MKNISLNIDKVAGFVSKETIAAKKKKERLGRAHFEGCAG